MNKQLIQLSEIPSFMQCEKQWYINYSLMLTTDNNFTILGTLAHASVDNYHKTYLPDNTIEISRLPVFSYKYNLYGYCDLVLLKRNKKNQITAVIPVEYKVRKHVNNEINKIQVIAQAFCLEEMFNQHIDTGCLYYKNTNKREYFQITNSHREKIINVMNRIQAVKEIEMTINDLSNLSSNISKCQGCSVSDYCDINTYNRISIPDIKQEINEMRQPK